MSCSIVPWSAENPSFRSSIAAAIGMERLPVNGDNICDSDRRGHDLSRLQARTVHHFVAKSKASTWSRS